MTFSISLKGVERRWGKDGFVVTINRLSLRAGDTVAFVGPSGCGKSTVLDLLAFALRPSRADRFELTDDAGIRHDVAALWRVADEDRIRALRGRNMGYVLQSGGLLPFLNAFENAMLSRRLLRLDGAGPIPQTFDALGLNGLEQRLPAKLSAGERQRVALARALAHRPGLLLADEPTAALDPGRARDAICLMTDVARNSDCATVIVSHDRALVESAGCKVVPFDVASGRASIDDGVPQP